jgi:hypothetical protein
MGAGYYQANAALCQDVGVNLFGVVASFYVHTLAAPSAHTAVSWPSVGQLSAINFGAGSCTLRKKRCTVTYSYVVLSPT